MPDSDDVLTQEQIDALLSGVDPKNPEKSINVAPTNLQQVRTKGQSNPQPAATPSAHPGLQTSSSQGSEIVDLAQRLARLEQVIPGQLQELAKKLESLIAATQGTVGYGARHSFVCRKCQGKGNVAAKLHCTSCGEENWWGWWPR